MLKYLFLNEKYFFNEVKKIFLVSWKIWNYETREYTLNRFQSGIKIILT